jgi:hypothetical protein
MIGKECSTNFGSTYVLKMPDNFCTQILGYE